MVPRLAQAASEVDRRRLKRAAAREFRIIQTLEHQGMLPVLDYKEHENGPHCFRILRSQRRSVQSLSCLKLPKADHRTAAEFPAAICRRQQFLHFGQLTTSRCEKERV